MAAEFPPPVPPPIPPHPWTPRAPVAHEVPLSYQGMSPELRRPGLVTAIGIISIVVGSLSTLWSAGSVLYDVRTYYLEQMLSAEAAAATAVLSNMPTAPAAAPVAAEMTQSQRQTAVDVFNKSRKLNAARQAQLDTLLAQAGRRMLAIDKDSEVTAAGVRAAIVHSGTMPGVEADEAGPDFFNTPGGRIELRDTSGVFIPADSGERVRSAVEISPGGVPVIPPSTPGTASSPVVTHSYTATSFGAHGTSGSSGAPGSPAGAAFAPFRGFTANIVAADVAAMSLNLCLAIYLIVCGILVLRNSPRGSALHRWYALLKLPLVIFAGITSYWISMLPVGTVPSILGPFMAATAAEYAFIAAIYPIALLIVQWTRDVRRYFQELRQTDGGRLRQY
jgi:hypothetical protein